MYLRVFLTHKGYKCLSVEGMIFMSKDVKFNEAEFPFSKLFATSFDHKVIDTHTNHTNVPFFLPTSNSKLLSKGPTEQLHQLTNKPNDPQNIDKPVSPPPSLTPQPSPTHTLSTGHSNDPSHVSNSFKSLQSTNHTDHDLNSVTHEPISPKSNTHTQLLQPPSDPTINYWSPNLISQFTKSLSLSFHTQRHNPNPLVNNHPMLTRSKNGKSKSKVFLVDIEPHTTK